MAWCNWARNVCIDDVDVIPVRSPGDLRQALAGLLTANPSGLRIRAVAGHYTTSRVIAPARPDGALVDVGRLMLDPVGSQTVGDPVVPLSDARFDHAGLSLGASARRRYFKVAAGASVEEVSLRLDRSGRALGMVGAFSGQTFVGAMSTSTHGSGFKHGTLADAVVSVDLTTIENTPNGPRVRELTVEPSVGTFTPGAIASDELFDALRVGLGRFGVITAVVIRSVPRFYLHQQTQTMTWRELVRGPLLPKDAQGRSVAIRNRYNAGCLIVPYPSGQGAQFDWRHCQLSWSRRHRRRSDKPAGAHPAPRGNGPAAALVKIGMAWAGRQQPNAIPSIVDSVLGTNRPPSSVFDLGYRVLSDPAGFPIEGVGIEYAFEADREPYVALVAMLDAVYEESLRGRYLAGFFSVRFVGPTGATLGLAPRPAVVVEVLSLRGVGAGETHVLPALESVALDHGGRPNWGLAFALGAPDSVSPGPMARIRNAYEPRLTAWQGAVASAGLNLVEGVFANEVVDALR